MCRSAHAVAQLVCVFSFLTYANCIFSFDMAKIIEPNQRSSKQRQIDDKLCIRMGISV